MAVQVKTGTWSVPHNRKFNLLALVSLDEHSLDNSKVYLLSKTEAEQNRANIGDKSLPDDFLLTKDRMDKLFS